MHRLSGAVIVAAAWIAVAPVASAQSVRYLKYTPAVVIDPAAPLLVEVEASGAQTQVTIDFNPAGTASRSIDLKDDGTGGDRAAGDQVYSVQLPAGPIVSALAADDVHRVFIGFLNLFIGTTRVFRGNLFVEVYGPDVGTYPISRLSQFVQATPFS